MTEQFLPRHTQIRHNADGALQFHLDGQVAALNTPRRALPLSDPDHFILLYDEEENELGVLRDIGELDEESQQVLGDALKRAYVIERIVRVLEVEKEALTGQVRWRVEIARDEIASDAIANDDSDGVSTEENSSPQSNGSNNGLSHAAQANNSQSDSEQVDEEQTDDGKFLNRLRLRLNRDRDGSIGEVTDEREFLINGQEDVQTARYPHIFIVDTERNRYEITNCEALDLESRRAAERFF